MIIILFTLIVIVFFVIKAIDYLKQSKDYMDSAYYQIAKLPYKEVTHDASRYGEYLTYKYLKGLEEDGAKFLFNVHIPKTNDTTTEIDVLMLCSKGIFVFESKNYGGWIFGSEGQKNWHQTLPNGGGRSQNICFYNPIMQNNSHIKHLKTILGNHIPMWSIIVFSERCTLKNIQVENNNIRVIKRNDVASTITAIYNQTPSDSLSEDDIKELYAKLYPYTQVTDETKSQHIANIRNTYKSQTGAQVEYQACTPIESMVQSETYSYESEDASDDLTASTETESVSQENISCNEDKLSYTDLSHEESNPLKCPYCGGNLVLRTATRGKNAGNQFYGCSNYPKCRYISGI